MKRINIRESLLNMDRETDCKYDLTSLYESVKLDDEKKKQLCQYIDKVDIDATNRFLSNEASSQGLMENASDDLSDDQLQEWYDTEGYTEVASKQVPDMDGFLTDYTMYIRNEDGWYVCVFGDKDIYGPDYYDWECETEEEAWEWFNSYNGFEDEEESSTDELLDSLNETEDELVESGISTVEPNFNFQGKSSHTFTKDDKWEVNFDEKGNILARTRHGKPSYFTGHINDKVNDFPSTDEDNIVLAAREQHELKFGKLNESKEVEIPENVDAIKLKENWEEFDINDYGNDEVITVVIIDKRFDPMFKPKHKEALKRNNVKIDGHYFNGTVVTGKVSDIIQVCDECCVMNPSKIFMESLTLTETKKEVEIPKGANHIHYRDNEPVMGSDACVYSLAELMDYWNNNFYKDPVLAEYDSFDAWWADTSKHLSLIESLNESKDELVEFSYRVYSLDEEGDELDCEDEFDNEEDAIEFAQSLEAAHVVFVPIPDSDEGPEYAEYIEAYSDYYDYEIIWSSNDSMTDNQITSQDSHKEININIADYRDGLIQFLADYGLNHLDVNVTKHNGKDVLYVNIENGDLKHEHLALTKAVWKFFCDKGILIAYDKQQYGESKDDTYSAKYFFYIDDIYTWFNESLNESWTDVYDQFITIVDIHFPDENKIESEIQKLYTEHKGEPDWDEAYRRWYEDDYRETTETFMFDPKEWVGGFENFNDNFGYDEKDLRIVPLQFTPGSDEPVKVELSGAKRFIDDFKSKYSDLFESLNEDQKIKPIHLCHLDDKVFTDNGNGIEVNTVDDIINLYGPATEEYLPKEFTFINIQNHPCLRSSNNEELINKIATQFSTVSLQGQRKPRPMYDAFGFNSPNPVEVRLFSTTIEDETIAHKLYQDTCKLMHLDNVAEEHESGYISKGELDYGCALVNQMRKGVKVYRVVARWMLISDNELENTLIKINDYNSQLNESLSKQTLDEGWFSDDDFEDDMMHTDLYGGDPMYCRTCGSKIDYSDGYGFCPKCNPQDDELEYVGEESIVDPDDLELVSNRFNPDDPGFDEYDLRESVTDNEVLNLLDKVPQVKSNIRSTEFYTENNQRFLDLVFSSSTDSFDYNSYKKELKKIFKDIYINSDDNCITIDITDMDSNARLYEGVETFWQDIGGGFGETNEIYGFTEIKDYWKNNYDSDPSLMEYDSFDAWWRDTKKFMKQVSEPGLNESHNPDNKDEVIAWLSDHDQAWEDITDFFGSNDLSEVELDSIIDWISNHEELDIDFARYFGLLDELDEDLQGDLDKSKESDILTIKSNIEDNLVLDNYMEMGSSNYDDYQIELFRDSDNYGGYPWWYKISKDGNTLTKVCYGDDLSNALYSVAQFIYNIKPEELDEDLQGDLDKRYRPSSINLRYLDKLRSSELVKSLEVVLMYDNEVVELTATDGRVFYLVPSTLSQFDVYDEQENLVATNLFKSEIPDELLATGEPNYIYQVVGGDYAGNYSREEIEALPCFSGKYTREDRYSKPELANQPILDGYLSPMFNGWRENHTACIRYETQEVYNMLSEDGKNLSSKKGTLGNLITRDLELINTFKTKEDIINWLIDIEPQCTNKKYLNKEVKPKMIRCRTFVDAYSYLYSIMLAGEGLRSIENEFNGRRKFAYESLEESWGPAYKELEKATHDVYDQGGWSEEMSEEETAELDKKAVAAAKSLLDKHSDDPDWQEAYKRLQINFDEHGIKEAVEPYKNKEQLGTPLSKLIVGDKFSKDGYQYEVVSKNDDFSDIEVKPIGKRNPKDDVNTGGLVLMRGSDTITDESDYLNESTSALTYQELMDLALEHYNEGGDRVYECWDEDDFNKAVEEFGPITKSKALEIFDHCNAVDNEKRAAAKYFSGELEESTQSIKCPVNGLYDGKEDNCFYFKDGQCTLPRDGGKPSEECKEYREWERKNSLQEAANGAAIKNLGQAITNIFKNGSKNDKAETISKIIDIIPDDFLDKVIDLIKDKFGNKQLSDEDVEKLSNTVGDNKLEEAEKGKIRTVAEFINNFNIVNISKEDPVLVKELIVIILGIIAIIEPTPIVEILTLIVQLLPANLIAGLMKILNPTAWAFDAIVDKKEKTESLQEDTEENWAVFATDESGNEYCAGVYESENYARYWAAQDKIADREYGYGNFEYRVEQVPEYTAELSQSYNELNKVKLGNIGRLDEE